MGKVDLQQIAPSTICKGPIDFDLYALRQGKMVLFCRKGFSITDQHVDSLERHGLSYYIRQSDWQLYLRYAKENIENLIDDPSVTTELKSQAVHSVNRDRVAQILDDPYSAEAKEKSGKVVDNYVRLILSDSAAAKNLFSLAALDVYTYSHALNVCSLSVLLAKELFEGDKKRMLEIGFAGLMHDVGKTRVDDAIIRKNGKLTKVEFEEVKKHPVYSEEIAAFHNYPHRVQQAARFHHERFCGGGYPDNLNGNQIPWIARLVAVVDVYDALTSKRVYKNEIRNVDALKLMHNESSHFDQNLFGCLMHVVLQNKDLVRRFAKENKILVLAN